MSSYIGLTMTGWGGGARRDWDTDDPGEYYDGGVNAAPDTKAGWV